MNATQLTEAAIKQYDGYKQQYPGVLLLFKIEGYSWGAGYFAYRDDAEICRRVLGLGLSLVMNQEPASGVPACCIPADELEKKLTRLIAAGHKVAICEPADVVKK